MTPKLEKNLYLKVPHFISIVRAKALAKEMFEHASFTADPQVANARCLHNHTSFLELLCEKTPDISKLCGEPVLPTYTYGRAYIAGNVLDRHKDRPACEISITLNLDGDLWPIWIGTPSGNKSVSLAPGDAMLYLGCQAEHWRDEFEGEHCEQVFLHYVRSRGPNAAYFFDHTPAQNFGTTFDYMEL